VRLRDLSSPPGRKTRPKNAKRPPHTANLGEFSSDSIHWNVQTVCKKTLSDKRRRLRIDRFREWAKEYGSVFSLKFGPSNIIVLCDREAIHELIDKKGSIYSDRPTTYVGNLLTKGDHIAISQADALWREKRKVIAHNFSPKMLDEKHFRVQEAE
jgi:cytochrome P450